MKDLLIEIGVEELPAIPFLKELKNIKKKWLNILDEYRFLSEVDFFYTPRRIIFYHKNFNSKQEDFTQEFFGAPTKIAYKDGEPTPALVGFAKKCGVEISQLQTSVKNNQEILYYKKEISGGNIHQHLEAIIDKFLKSLSFGKTMRWGKNDFAFIRPIRWICVKLDKETLNLTSYGVKSGDFSYSHRQLSSTKIIITQAQKYFEILNNNGVIVKQDDRKSIILEQFEKIQKQIGLKIYKDDDLLSELVAITEHPQALVGHFDKKFLNIPSEIIIYTMRENQRYFSLLKNDILEPSFLVIADTLTNKSTKILEGNTKVLLARLEDALFFYNNDLKNGFNIQPLENISFMKNMGSLLDKVHREENIGKYLASIYDENEKKVTQSILIAKADLLTQSVYEFTDLQGIIGAKLAKRFDYGEDICIAIKEQYLPDGQNSNIPSSRLSSIVAISNKLDLLFSLFSTNQIPTGSKDPYALRRAVIGIIKISTENKLHFDINKISQEIQKHYNKVDVNKIIDFFYERMYQYFKTNNSLISSIISTKEYDILKFSYKLKALEDVIKKEDFRKNFATFKRVSNMINSKNIEKDVSVNQDLFSNEYEKNLYINIVKIQNHNYNSYEKHLEDLFNLENDLSDFFDNVMVNDENENIKNNRQNILKIIYKEFFKIADIKVVSF